SSLGSVAPPRVDDEILALGIAQLAHAAAKRLEIRRRWIRALDRCPGDAKRSLDLRVNGPDCGYPQRRERQCTAKPATSRRNCFTWARWHRRLAGGTRGARHLTRCAARRQADDRSRTEASSGLRFLASGRSDRSIPSEPYFRGAPYHVADHGDGIRPALVGLPGRA